MHVIRPVQPDDLESLYGISLATGHEGRDSAYLYIDPKMMGHIYVAPYAVLAPSMSLVAHDEVGVVGFVAGAIDTAQRQTTWRRSGGSTFGLDILTLTRDHGRCGRLINDGRR